MLKVRDFRLRGGTVSLWWEDAMTMQIEVKGFIFEVVCRWGGIIFQISLRYVEINVKEIMHNEKVAI